MNGSALALLPGLHELLECLIWRLPTQGVVGAIATAYSFQIAIALLAAIYFIDMIATVFLIPERKGSELQ